MSNSTNSIAFFSQVLNNKILETPYSLATQKSLMHYLVGVNFKQRTSIKFLNLIHISREPEKAETFSSLSQFNYMASFDLL